MVSVIRTSSTGAWIGFEGGKWVIETGRGIVALEQPVSFMGALPLLERSHSEFLEELEDSLASVGMPKNLAATFPVNSLVLYALSTASAYWKQLALSWLEDVPVSSELIGALERIVRHSGWPQKLRHEARRLLNSTRQLHRKSAISQVNHS